MANNFIKHFDKLTYRHDAFNAFNDFCAIAAIALSNPVNYNEERENEYLRIINSYNKDEQEVFPLLFADVIQQFISDSEGTPKYRDFLGDTFQELGLANKWKAQFFTPQCISDMIGVVNAGDLKQYIDSQGYATVLEPCIGGGSMVLGLVNALFQQGLNPTKQIVVTAYDLDIRCVHMAYIQLSLAGVPAMIQQRNTLTNETYGDFWYTPVFIFDGWDYKLHCRQMVNSLRFLAGEMATVEPAPVEQPIQLSLF